MARHTVSVPSDRPAPKGRSQWPSASCSGIDQNGHIEVVDGGPTPSVTVDTDRQLHTESGIITHAGEQPGWGEWLAVIEHP